MPPVRDLSDEQVRSLPIDRLSLALLADLVASNAWNRHNVVIEAQQHQHRDQPALQAITEAMSWLEMKGLIASPKPGQTSADSFFVTRLGHRVLGEGERVLMVHELLARDLHPTLADVRSQFLLGQYELGAFAAMRQVEIAVRESGGFGNDRLGVALMRDAFHPDRGPLTDSSAEKGERQGVMELFSGAIATFKNPSSHRQVEFDDPVIASEIVTVADLLLRMIDATQE